MSKITINQPVETKPEVTTALKRGCFYRNKRSGTLVFVAGDTYGEVREMDDAVPRKTGMTVAAIGSYDNGLALMGLLGNIEDYEEVDVELTVRLPKA